MTADTRNEVRDIAEKLRAGALSTDEKLDSIEERLELLQIKPVGSEEDVEDSNGAMRQAWRRIGGVEGDASIIREARP